MNNAILPACAVAVTLALTIVAGCATPNADVAAASSVPLLATQWRLTQLGGQLVHNPAGDRAIGLQLQARNTRATGFAGCNRMFGGYALSNDTLRFEQMGATKMACLDDTRMALEQRYLALFPAVARWKISGDSLELYDSNARLLASFAAHPPPTQR